MPRQQRSLAETGPEVTVRDMRIGVQTQGRGFAGRDP